MFFLRSRLTEMLYNALGSCKSKIVTSCSIQDIHMTETGVLLRLGDGTSIDGSIVVGADGVHSQVRDISK